LGQALLHQLYDFATKDEYIYSHEWTVGDLLICDNSVSQAPRGAALAATGGRLRHRVNLVGDASLAGVSLLLLKNHSSVAAGSSQLEVCSQQLQ